MFCALKTKSFLWSYIKSEIRNIRTFKQYITDKRQIFYVQLQLKFFNVITIIILRLSKKDILIYQRNICTYLYLNLFLCQLSRGSTIGEKKTAISFTMHDSSKVSQFINGFYLIFMVERLHTKLIPILIILNLLHSFKYEFCHPMTKYSIIRCSRA